MVWTNLWVTALVALAVVLVTFAIGVTRKLHRVIDIAWGLGFAAIAIASVVLSAGHGSVWNRVLPTALTVVWGVRLATHIFLRGRGHGEDPRYATLLSRASGNPNWYALRMVYLLQAAILWFVSIPVQVVQYQKDTAVWALVLGSVVWAIGFVFESVGDYQLARFRNDPSSRGRVLDTGLWRYTRHPNYFGDATVWWGLWLLGIGSWTGLVTVLSPLLMTYFLAGKTGKPLLEKDITSRRPGYADYVRRTSGFFPLPPRL
jgi:steroid 5-alpha reductase family enzyme